MQALDYWIRVRALNEDRQPAAAGGWPVSAFERQGYFAGAEVSPAPPRLLLAAPALRIHPANEPVLRYLSTQAEVSPAPPRLLLAAPALRIHPANEPVLRYLSTQIEWELIALSEHWRRELKVVFRKHAAAG
jgi:hypothetical protein